MKQRIRVTAICERDGKILLLKRATGRVEGMNNYELPTGKIIFGEQPDEAMARIVYENLAVQAQELLLEDVVTFTDLEYASELANLFIVYRINNWIEYNIFFFNALKINPLFSNLNLLLSKY
jgi:ADP-ribose pyrophosphatase YjhB (NUDIX family)